MKFYLKEDMTFTIFLKNLISYSGTRYSWYIEMYIGLFILIPFFNIIINSLKSKREYQMILITLIVLIALPSILNIFKFDSIEWWKKPSISNNYVKILPAWWTSIYPVLYYFLGAYFLSIIHIFSNSSLSTGFSSRSAPRCNSPPEQRP